MEEVIWVGSKDESTRPLSDSQVSPGSAARVHERGVAVLA